MQNKFLNRLWDDGGLLYKYEVELFTLLSNDAKGVDSETHKRVLEARIHAQKEKVVVHARTLVKDFGANRLLWDSASCKYLYPALEDVTEYSNEFFAELNKHLPKWGFELPYAQSNSALSTGFTDEHDTGMDDAQELAHRQKVWRMKMNPYISTRSWYLPHDFRSPLPLLRFHIYEDMERLSENMDEVAELLGNLLKTQKDIVGKLSPFVTHEKPIGDIYALIDDRQGNNQLPLKGGKILILPEGDFAWVDKDNEERFTDESIVRVINEMVSFH